MKMLFVLGALLLAFQVKSAEIEPARVEVGIETWELDTLSPYFYDEIESASLVIDLMERSLTLKMKTDRDEQLIEAKMNRSGENACGARVITAFDQRRNQEVIVTDYRRGICPRKGNQRGVEIETRSYEHKSLKPSVDYFYSATQNL